MEALSKEISIHALLAESDVQRGPRPHERGHFYPRSPCGERLMRPYANLAKPGFLSTLSLRRATGLSSLYSIVRKISIHALLAESDAGGHQKQDGVFGISIHALLAESDRPSRPPASRQINFYPRSPCGERPLQTSMRR